MADPDDIYGIDEETGEPLTRRQALGETSLDDTLPIGVGEETGLPVRVGTGKIVDPQTAGSDQVSEQGTKGDPFYDPEQDLFHFIHGTVAEPDWSPGEIEMNPSPEENDRTSFNIKEGQRASAGFRGMTDEGIKESDKLFGPARERSDAKNDALADQYQADVKRLQAQTEMKRALLDDYALKEQEHFDNVAEIRRQQMELNIKAKQAEEIAAQRARANADQYIAHYNDEMAGVRQLMMQSGNPLGGLTAIQGGAMGAALFAQGFLGARYGIKVDVAGQIDRWVTQEMNAHQNKIANLSNAAQGQLKLYDIARQQGLDDQLTRDRLKGFAIDAMKANLYMESARYQSATAQNDAKVKAAELDALQLDNEMKMRNKLIEQQMGIARDEIDAAYKQGSLSIQQRNAEIDAYRAANQAKQDAWLRKRTDKLDDAALNAPAPVEDYSWTEITDPGKPHLDENGNIDGYETTWMLSPTALKTMPPNLVSDTMKDIADRQALYGQGVKALGEVREYLEDHPDAFKRNFKGEFVLNNEENREYRRKVLAAFMEARHALFGAALTGTEKPDFEAFYGEDYLFQRGTNGAKALTDFESMMRNKMTSTIESKPGVILNPRPRIKPADVKMNITKARSKADQAGDAPVTPAQRKEGEIEGFDRNVPLDGKFTNPWDPNATPSPTVTDRALNALGAQVVTGMEHYNEVIEPKAGRTGKAEALDGIAALQRQRDKGNQRAAQILEQLKPRFYNDSTGTWEPKKKEE